MGKQYSINIPTVRIELRYAGVTKRHKRVQNAIGDVEKDRATLCTRIQYWQRAYNRNMPPEDRRYIYSPTSNETSTGKVFKASRVTNLSKKKHERPDQRHMFIANRFVRSNSKLNSRLFERTQARTNQPDFGSSEEM